MNESTFLDQSELAILTGRKIKSLQIAALRDMGIRFVINATGHPVVTRSALEGRKDIPPINKEWKSHALGAT